MSYLQLLSILKGGPTSGNFGHSGRPGIRGGSQPGGGHGKIGISGDMSQAARHELISKLRAARGSKFPADLTTLKFIKSAGGSTGADLVEGPDGKQYIRKRGKSEKHLREEAYADAAYQAAGVDVPKFKLYETPDGPVKLAEFIEGRSLRDVMNHGGQDEIDAAIKGAQKGFAMDALLSNRDSVGLDYDNMLIDKSGKVWRIDNGGSLRYRAQGAAKSDWGDNPNDFNTLRNRSYNASAARVFGDISSGELKRQVRDLSSRRKAILNALPEALRQTVSNRLDNMQAMVNNP